MDSDRYQRAKTIFFQACDCPVESRADFVNDACSGDPLLRDAVLQLLSHDADPLTLVNESALRQHLEKLVDSSGPDADDGDARSPSHRMLPSHIGAYRILELLGEGGMGVVYLAEQDNPRRQVALKVIARGHASRSMLRRFEHEAQILGRLHHPGIAQIYDAGTHDAGQGAQPFFAMELVRGLSLMQYCDHAHADVPTKLHLFIAVCEAVQHAHQQGVIHRDLKPANILVTDGLRPEAWGLRQTTADGNTWPKPQVAGLPKILDFGVARLTDSDLQVTTMHTAADQIIGTVAYMSPEQLSGQSSEVDMRSDVYALGVILFELLSGRLPHDVSGKTMPEAIRIVGQDEPTALASLSRAYRGDLDTIVAKALERDKSRRYQAASELAADVRRYLDDQPIHARPPSTLYQFRKFAKRNRSLVGGVVGVFLVLILGIIGTTWQASQAIAARDEQIKLRNEADDSAKRAIISAEKAMAVNSFLRNMLASAQPEVAQGRDVMVGEVLDSAAREIVSTTTLQPDVEAAIRLTIGETYLAIGRVSDAHDHVEKALELSRQAHGEPSAEVAQALALLASTKNSAGEWDQAITLIEQALAMFRTVHRGDHADIASALSGLANYRRNRAEMALAVSLMRESLEMLQRIYGDEHLQVAIAQARLADMLHNPVEAEPLLRAALATLHSRLGELHPTYIRRIHQYAGLLLMRRDYEQAEATFIRSIDLASRVYTPNHPDVLTMVTNLGFCYQMAGRRDKLLEIRERAVEMSRAIYGDESMRTAEQLMDRADAHGMNGDFDAYLSDFRAALDIAVRAGQSDDVRANSARLSIAAELLRLGRGVDEAEALCDHVLKSIESAPPEHQWMRGQALSLKGGAAMQRRDFAGAERLLLEGFERIGTSRLTIVRRRAAVERLVQLYETWDAAEPGLGKIDLAAPWRERLEELRPRPTAATAPASNVSKNGN